MLKQIPGDILTPTSPQLLSAKDAAERLAIGERKLWALTASGEIPCVRIGRAVRYSVNDLANFVAANTKGGQQ